MIKERNKMDIIQKLCLFFKMEKKISEPQAGEKNDFLHRNNIVATVTGNDSDCN